MNIWESIKYKNSVGVLCRKAHGETVCFAISQQRELVNFSLRIMEAESPPTAPHATI